jgi:glutathione S-transferase
LRLLNDATSPFGRKVMMAALSRRIAVSEEFVDLSQLEEISRFNPLGQIPVLLLPDGSSLYDSQTIMLHLDECHGGPRLFPLERRAQLLTGVSLCDGVMEATLQRLLETRRPAAQQSAEFIAKLEQRIRRGMLALEELDRPARDGGALLASDIAVIAALGYCDFRYTEAWRSFCPRLAAWYATHAELALARATAPTRKTPASLR